APRRLREILSRWEREGAPGGGGQGGAPEGSWTGGQEGDGQTGRPLGQRADGEGATQASVSAGSLSPPSSRLSPRPGPFARLRPRPPPPRRTSPSRTASAAGVPGSSRFRS